MSQVTACALNPAEQPFEKHQFLLGLVPLTANAKLSQNENEEKILHLIVLLRVV
jgi:hypothetical protein